MISKKIKENYPLQLDALGEYIEATYGEHYADEENSVQTMDFFESLGTLETTARDNAIKYLARYGKKDGKNKKDLFKAMHYIMMILELNHPQQKK